MPGLFGVIGINHQLRNHLREQFSSPWGTCESVSMSNGIMGGHAFGQRRSVHVLDDGTHLALDGERSIYSINTSQLEYSRALELARTFKGNVAIATKDLWHLVTDWSGGFPLYYAHTKEGFLFCSRLRPLAAVLCPEIDIVGLRQFLHAYYMLSGRTFYKGISRLLPGQVLTYDHERNMSSITETSQAWVGFAAPPASQVWTGLLDAVSTSMEGSRRHGLMMSGGWDSRTLLAAAEDQLGAEKIYAYSHGGKDAFEKEIASEICHSLGVKFHYEPLSDALYDLDFLKRGFSQTETVVFPEWHRAALLLRASGIDCVSSGVFGEVLGGHYNRTTISSGTGKVRTFLMQVLGCKNSMVEVFDAFKIQDLVKPQFVNHELWGDMHDLQAAMNGDIESSLRRLVKRGIQSPDQLIEAFITEHRGSQYITSQMLSCRAYLDVAIPFADRELLSLASRIPLRDKLHNALNRRVLKKYRYGILRFPTAAAPVPASMPILVQELSRLFRRIAEERLKLDPFGWWDWEFLRDGAILNTIVDDLKLDFWNKNAMRQKIKDVETGRTGSIGLLRHRLQIVYTVDLMLRTNVASHSIGKSDPPPISQTPP